jgi:hypothetical protein
VTEYKIGQINPGDIISPETLGEDALHDLEDMIFLKLKDSLPPSVQHVQINLQVTIWQPRDVFVPPVPQDSPVVKSSE